MKRGIVYYYRGQGDSVDAYAIDVLQSILQYSQSVIVVCGQEVNPQFLKRFTDEIHAKIVTNAYMNLLQAYVAGIDRLDDKKSFDEVLCISDSVMGPLSDPRPIFKASDEWKNSAWGLAFQKMYVDSKDQKYLSLDFIALRKNIFLGTAIYKHIRKMSYLSITNDDELSFAFSQYLTTLGCILRAYLSEDTTKSYRRPFFDNPEAMCRVSPFFWKEAFYCSPRNVYVSTSGCNVPAALQYLTESSIFNVDTLWNYLFKKQNIADIHHCIKPDLVLSVDSTLPYCSNIEYSCALLIHLYYEDILYDSYVYVKNIPETMDLLITTVSSEMKSKILAMFSNIPCRKLVVRIVSERGRSESAFLLGFSQEIFQYDLVCFVHDKKTMQIQPPSVGQEFNRMGMEGCLASKEYIKNVICSFKQHPRLGLACALPTNVGQYYNILGAYEWGDNAKEMVDLAERLTIDKNLIDPKKRLLAPFGSYFWFRPIALKPLLDYPWELKDFPEEPVGSDGSLLHAIERIYPFVAQTMGYYTAYCTSNQSAAQRMEDWAFQIRSINQYIGNNVQDFYDALNRIQKKFS